MDSELGRNDQRIDALRFVGRLRAAGFRGVIGCPPSAFSLVELLGVMAILAIVMAFAIPAFNTIGTGQKMSRAVSDLTDLLEYAKAEAMARKTYVWVGFKNLPSTDAANPSGNHQVACAAFFSADGTATAAATGSASTLKALSKVVRLEGVKLVQGYGAEEISEQVRALWAGEYFGTGGAEGKVNPKPVSVATNTDPKSGLPSDFARINFSNVSGEQGTKTITFTPQGEAMLKGSPTPTSGFTSYIDLGLKRMRGDAPDLASPDDAVIWIAGSTGGMRIHRLK
jgi:prepilin-type N-terminal cleavage/methylation domain-containing protein